MIIKQLETKYGIKGKTAVHRQAWKEAYVGLVNRDFARLFMGFISFNEEYYRRKLEEYENKILSDADICEAKQLLKVLDDLTDEGYTNLNDTMSNNRSGNEVLSGASGAVFS